MIDVDLYRRLPALVIVGVSSAKASALAEGVRSILGDRLPRQRVVVTLKGSHTGVNQSNRIASASEIAREILNKMAHANPKKRNPTAQRYFLLLGDGTVYGPMSKSQASAQVASHKSVKHLYPDRKMPVVMTQAQMDAYAARGEHRADMAEALKHVAGRAWQTKPYQRRNPKGSKHKSSKRNPAFGPGDIVVVRSEAYRASPTGPLFPAREEKQKVLEISTDPGRSHRPVKLQNMRGAPGPKNGVHWVSPSEIVRVARKASKKANPTYRQIHYGDPDYPKKAKPYKFRIGTLVRTIADRSTGGGRFVGKVIHMGKGQTGAHYTVLEIGPGGACTSWDEHMLERVKSSRKRSLK